MRVHVVPPSSDRNSPPCSASMSAYTRLGSDGATATPTLPQTPSGNPGPLSCFQVSPASREPYRPLPGPPLVMSQGVRRACHNPAKTMLGLEGSNATSDAP